MDLTHLSDSQEKIIKTKNFDPKNSKLKYENPDRNHQKRIQTEDPNTLFFFIISEDSNPLHKAKPMIPENQQ